jgi:hypothetical protein
VFEADLAAAGRPQVQRCACTRTWAW